jgi:hypothetical protein
MTGVRRVRAQQTAKKARQGDGADYKAHTHKPPHQLEKGPDLAPIILPKFAREHTQMTCQDGAHE